MGKRRRGRPTGHKLSPESCAKISESKRGKHHTAEGKENIRQGVLRYQAKVREALTLTKGSK